MYSDTNNDFVTILFQLYILVHLMVLLQETVGSDDKHHKPFVKGYDITCCLFLQLVSYITMKSL
jgi:hypothetical protein